MRATTHISIFFVVIQCRLAITRDILLQNFHFVAFATGIKGIPSFLPADFALYHIVFGFRQFQHPRFQRR